MTPEISISALKAAISQAVQETHFLGTRRIILRHDTPVAALVTLSDLRMLEAFEAKSTEEKALEMQARLIAWTRAKAARDDETDNILIR